MNRAVATATMVLLLPAAVRAQAPAGWDPMPNWSIRQLAAWSEIAVVAVPAGPASAQRFKATRVLLGSALKEGDVFEIDDFSRYDLTVPAAEGASGGKPARPAELLLFLEAKQVVGPPTRFSLTPSGLRIETTDGGLYYPEQRQDSGPYHLRPYKADVLWDELVRKAAADTTEVSYVRSLKAITDPRRRNAAVLDWVESRRREFGGGMDVKDGGEPSSGWGSLEWDVFDWVFESRIAADCWAATKLYAELNGGAIPGWHVPVFGTRAGRALLLSVATDDAALTGHRVRALEALSRILTLWPGEFGGDPPVEPLDAKGQTALIDRERPLLKDPSPAVRAAASAALLELSAPHGDVLKPFHTQRALPALTEAYKKEPPGPARDALAEAVCGVAGPKAWQELTGNGHGVVVALKDPGCRQGAEVFCWMAVRRTDDGIREEPTLLLERLDDGGKAVEKKEVQPAMPMSVPQPDGWTAGAVQYITISMTDFTPGVWRMTERGTAGRDKAAWMSEPRLLHLAPPTTPGQPNPNPDARRITFNP